MSDAVIANTPAKTDASETPEKKPLFGLSFLFALVGRLRGAL